MNFLLSLKKLVCPFFDSFFTFLTEKWVYLPLCPLIPNPSGTQPLAPCFAVEAMEAVEAVEAMEAIEAVETLEADPKKTGKEKNFENFLSTFYPGKV